MDWAAWEPTYRAICAQFGYREEDDLAAARELRQWVGPTRRFRDLGVRVRNRRDVAIVGAGPSLDQVKPAVLVGRVVVACDGATTWLRQNGTVPDLVVTDLDGAPEDLLWAARQGSAMVVHAHGDNRAAIRELAPRLGPQIYGTYQCEPVPELEPMRNVGGFTDGDRAVAMCEELGTRSVVLFGFDFDAPPGRYSHHWNPATKPAKLAWAQRLVGEAVARGAMGVVRYMP